MFPVSFFGQHRNSLSVTLGEFRCRFLKCSFQICIRSSWLAAFSLAIGVLFFLLTLLTVCHAIRNFLSSKNFLFYRSDLEGILLVLFLCVLIRSLCVILNFFALALFFSMLNTQHYKIRIKGKVNQSRERSSALPYNLGKKLSKKEPSGHP